MAGAFAGLLFLKFLNVSEPVLFMAVVVAGGMFPDVDLLLAFGKRKKFSLFSHRGFTHTVFALVLFSLIVQALFGWVFALGFAAAYFSHLLLDSFTPMGVKPLLPLKWKIKGSFKTGSVADNALFFILLLANAALLLA